MKIIKTNDIKIGELELKNEPFYSPEASFTNMIEGLKVENIHFAEIEQKEGNLLGALKISPFAKAVHYAFSQHLPLILTPDIIWHMISLGVSIHINQNAGSLRDQIISDLDWHLDDNGKKKITIRVAKSNWFRDKPWSEVIDEFSQKLKTILKFELSDIMTANFSTTNKVSKLTSQIVLLDSVQKFIDYFTPSLCGIPEIRVDGCKEDWIKVKSKTEQIIQQIPALNIWFKNGLEEILNNFIDIFDNKIDDEFWKSIYKKNGGSGGPYLTGWFIALFPYICKSNKKNPYVWETNWRNVPTNSLSPGLTLDAFQIFLSQVDCIWETNEKDLKIQFIAGLVGILHGKDESLMPVFGNAIVVKNSEKTETLNYKITK